ncbi:methyltransferase domain-containing protein [Haliangium sp.]|uniref:methyltransferase domain-containing protein n=1 Tax=Haliangium sp. TaxID=2663208 RepID=UPI003D11C36D
MMHEAKVAALYEKGSAERLKLKKHPYNNIGYWTDDTSDMDEAAQNMLKELVTRGGLEGAEAVLDAGCGYGQCTVDLRRVYGCKSVTGIDISDHLVEFARKLAADTGVQDSVRFERMSATELGFDADTFTHVIAVDCSCHFNTRVDFFKEAYRVLKPGGVLVLSDGIPVKFPEGMVWRRISRRLYDMWCIPLENVYSLETYTRLIEEAGFGDVRAESVVDRVLIPAIAYITSPAFEEKYRAHFGWFKTGMTMRIYKRMARACERGYLDYGFIVARKS